MIFLVNKMLNVQSAWKIKININKISFADSIQ